MKTYTGTANAMDDEIKAITWMSVSDLPVL